MELEKTCHDIQLLKTGVDFQNDNKKHSFLGKVYKTTGYLVKLACSGSSSSIT